MNFYWQKLRDNVFNQKYYQAVIQGSARTSLNYYFKLAFWLALFYTAIIAIVFLPTFLNLAHQVVNDFTAAYPAELKIHFQNSEASVNQPEPVVIPLPAAESSLFNLQTDSTKRGIIANLLTVDTRQTATSGVFMSSRSLFYLDKNSMWGFGGQNGKLMHRQLPTDTNVIIDRTFISNLSNRLNWFLVIFTPFSVLLVYALALIFFVFSLLEALIVAILAWLLFKLGKTQGSGEQSLWSQAWKASLHAITLPFVVNLVVFVTYPSFALNFSFVVTFALLVIYLNLISKPKPTFVSANQPVDPSISAAETKPAATEPTETADSASAKNSKP